MNRAYDIIVIGLGAMGSAAADHLSRRGLKVLGLDRFRPPHDQGSSHGHTRMIREAYFEDPVYVPLVQRAYENWTELERDTDQRLFLQTGGLMIGPPDGELVSGAQASAEAHGLPYECLSAKEIQTRFPALNPGERMEGVWEPRAGVLFVEDCIQAQLQRAQRHGATLRFNEAVSGWRASSDGVEVTSARGSYTGGQLLMTAGPWLPELVPQLRLPLQVERQVLYWFTPAANAEAFSPDRFPVYIFEYGSEQFVYGFPLLNDEVKAGFHHQGEITDPQHVRREVSAEEEAHLRELLQKYLPDANGELARSVVCLYTNTPDFHFAMGPHPDHANVYLASPCSGHGFKFASALGELWADLLTGESAAFDLELFRLDRFS